MRVSSCVAFAILVTLGGAFAVACHAQTDDDLPPKAVFESSVASHLAPGATLDDIRAYLDTAGRELGLRAGTGVATAAEADEVRLVQMEGLDPDTPVYGAFVRGNVRQVVVVFVLDANLRFERAVVIEDHINAGL